MAKEEEPEAAPASASPGDFLRAIRGQPVVVKLATGACRRLPRPAPPPPPPSPRAPERRGG